MQEEENRVRLEESDVAIASVATFYLFSTYIRYISRSRIN